jgi:hypothetical protein
LPGCGAMAFPAYALCVAHATTSCTATRSRCRRFRRLDRRGAGAAVALLMAQAGNRALFLHTVSGCSVDRRRHRAAAGSRPARRGYVNIPTAKPCSIRPRARCLDAREAGETPEAARSLRSLHLAHEGTGSSSRSRSEAPVRGSLLCART